MVKLVTEAPVVPSNDDRSELHSLFLFRLSFLEEFFFFCKVSLNSSSCHETILCTKEPIHIFGSKVSCVNCVVVVVMNSFIGMSQPELIQNCIFKSVTTMSLKGLLQSKRLKNMRRDKDFITYQPNSNTQRVSGKEGHSS
jgi:hypothetical protein